MPQCPHRAAHEAGQRTGTDVATASYVSKVEKITEPAEPALPQLSYAFPNPFARWLAALLA